MIAPGHRMADQAVRYGGRPARRCGCVGGVGERQGRQEVRVELSFQLTGTNSRSRKLTASLARIISTA